MNKYKVVCIVSGSTYFPSKREEVVSADSLEDTLDKVRRYWSNNYMHCDFLSIVKEEDDE